MSHSFSSASRALVVTAAVIIIIAGMKLAAALLVPFLLDGVGGVPELNQADGIHPTPEGHEILAENVWKVLQPALRVNSQP